METIIYGVELMEIKDKKIKKMVDMREASCLKKDCYWPRQHPGIFVQGQGYHDTNRNDWICGTRQAHGCPLEESKNHETEKILKLQANKIRKFCKRHPLIPESLAVFYWINENAEQFRKAHPC